MTEQLHEIYVNGLFQILCMAKSATYSNLEKLNGDKTQLKTFFAQLNLKLQYNIDYFTRKKQKTEQNKLSYIILQLEKKAFA